MGALRLELLRGGASSDAAAGSSGPGRAAGLNGGSRGAQRLRIVDATLACIERQGTSKTTLDDVAREAGCSRATVYRVFPGGKDAVLSAVVETELSRFFSALAVRMGEAATVEEVLVAGMHEAARSIAANRALSHMLEHEPEVVLPFLAFSQMDLVLEVSSSFTAPFLGRWLDHGEALRVAEWAARIVISYLACPAQGVDLADEESVRHLVRTYVLPGIRLLESDPPDARQPHATRGRAARRDGANRSNLRSTDNRKGEHR